MQALIDTVRCFAEGGSASDAYALAAAKALCQGGTEASSVAQAFSQAIAQYGCSAIQPVLTSKITYCEILNFALMAFRRVAYFCV